MRKMIITDRERTVRRLTADELTRLVDMREAGKTYKAISLEIGCSESTVYWHCLRLGADAPNPRKLTAAVVGPQVVMRGGKPVRRFTAAEDARLLALEAEGMNECEIGAVLGRQHNSVRARLMTLARREARAEAHQPSAHSR